MKRINNKFFIISLSLVLVLTLSIISLAADKLEVHFIDVGQADSILIVLPNEQSMLIDAGNNGDGDLVVNYIKNQGIEKIDYLIGTHPHEDHIGGLDDVIKSFNIGNVYMPGVTHTTKTFEDVLLAIQAKGMKIKTAKAGLSIIEDNNLNAYFLSPINNDYDELNYWSAVVKLEYGDNSFLFTGDAEDINEQEMLYSSHNNLKADLLKVGHHGSDSSTTESFLEDVNPLYGVISVGKGNSYGHPSNSVLSRLQRHDVKIYRTDEQGTIIAVSDGKNISFNKDSLLLENNQSINNNNGVKIVDVSLQDEYVIIKNFGDSPVDISGWRLLSVTGNQDFYFPNGTVLNSGETIKIVSGRNAEAGPGIIVWSKGYIWNNDGDPAILYDTVNNKVSSF